MRATAYNSRVVYSGFLPGRGVGLLGEESHHNRIAVVCSQISGIRPNPAHRWTYDRLERTAIDLLARDELRVEALISHVLPVDAAQHSWMTCTTSPGFDRQHAAHETRRVKESDLTCGDAGCTDSPAAPTNRCMAHPWHIRRKEMAATDKVRAPVIPLRGLASQSAPAAES